MKKEIKLRHYLITSFLRPFIGIFLKISYRLKYKNYKELKNKGPFVILSNHTVNPDPIALGLSFPFLIYFIATEQIFNLGFLSKLLVWAVNPIKKSKAQSDITTIRKARRIVSEGGSIGIYPEGNVTYTGRTVKIEKSTVKLIKLLKIPVIIFIKEGLFLSNPRWSLKRKKGKAKQYIRKIIYPEEYLLLSDDDLYELIKELLYVDAYKEQYTNPIHYKGKDLALGLERLIFMDLKSNIPFVTYSKGNRLYSKESDFTLTYQTDGFIKNQNNELKTLYDYENLVKLSYFNYYINHQNDLNYKEEIILFESHSNKKNFIGTVFLNLSYNKLKISSKKFSEIFLFDKILNMSIQGKRQIIIYINDNTYLLKLNELSSPYKYLLTYQYYLFIKNGGKNIDEQLYQFGL